MALSLVVFDDRELTEESNIGINYRFGKAVRRRRRELDLSQEELAERAELHRTYISSVERGRMNPSLENVEKIAKALAIPLSALFANYGIEASEQSE